MGSEPWHLKKRKLTHAFGGGRCVIPPMSPHIYIYISLHLPTSPHISFLPWPSLTFLSVARLWRKQRRRQ